MSINQKCFEDKRHICWGLIFSSSDLSSPDRWVRSSTRTSDNEHLTHDLQRQAGLGRTSEQWMKKLRSRSAGSILPLRPNQLSINKLILSESQDKDCFRLVMQSKVRTLWKLQSISWGPKQQSSCFKNEYYDAVYSNRLLKVFTSISFSRKHVNLHEYLMSYRTGLALTDVLRLWTTRYWLQLSSSDVIKHFSSAGNRRSAQRYFPFCCQRGIDNISCIPQQPPR